MKRMFAVMVVILVWSTLACASEAFSVGSAWSDPVGGKAVSIAGDTVQWGKVWGLGIPCWKSSLTFSGSDGSFEYDTPFVLGELVHTNRPIDSSSSLDSVLLSLDIDLAGSPYSWSGTMFVDETVNWPGYKDDYVYLPAGYVEGPFTVLGWGVAPDDLVGNMQTSECAMSSMYLWGQMASPAAVPVPGAAVLAALGTGLVGWFRRRSF